MLVFTLFRYFPYGGLQRDFLRIALACQARGYRVMVYCLNWQGERPEGFEIVEVPVRGVGNHTRAQQFAEYVADHARWRLPACVIGFNKMPGLDIYYAADSCFEHKAQQMRSGVYRWTRRYKLFSSYERAVFNPDATTHILLIAQAQQQQFARYYDTPAERLHMLPPGVARDRRRGADWRQQRRRVRAEFGVADDGFLLLQVGSGFITKGLDRVLHALSALPADLRLRSRLLVIGEDNATSFLRLADKLGVREQLTISAGRDDIPAVLQGADIMVHPAYMESGGLVLIEAIIAGLPVLATSVCGFAHYIHEADAGVVLAEPFCQTDLNQNLRQALINTTDRQAWSANGVAFGQQQEGLYDMPNHALGVIEAVLGEQAKTLRSGHPATVAD
ncbi:MAG: glycosyltransferase family 4 protein [Pseudomonadota bacterium]